MKQVKAYFSAEEKCHNPVNKAMKDSNGHKLGRGKSWMGPAEDSILQVCQLTELRQTKEWKRQEVPGVLMARCHGNESCSRDSSDW